MKTVSSDQAIPYRTDLRLASVTGAQEVDFWTHRHASRAARTGPQRRRKHVSRHQVRSPDWDAGSECDLLAARFLLTGEAAHTVRLNRRYHVRRDYSEPAGAPTFWHE
jgi:hypothetical protein